MPPGGVDALIVPPVASHGPDPGQPLGLRHWLVRGGEGARASVGPRGTYVSLTAHGFQYFPILRNGEVAITSPHGVRIVFQVSRPEAAFRAAHALNTLAELARRPFQAPRRAARGARPRRPAPT